MQSNKNIKGLAVFSQEEQIKERSLRLYIYLICRANLRNTSDKFGDNVRIFQQKDINLQEIKRILGFDPNTTKKYLAGLEEEGLIKFCPRGWNEQLYKEVLDKNNNISREFIGFNERWKIRNKHKETYYEMPINKNQLFRKIPKETLIDLNEIHEVNELTLKIYITLVNFQEECIFNNYSYKKFTYNDLRTMLGYKLKYDTNRKIESCLNLLSSLKLIEIEKGEFINTYGVTIPCFCLNQANFYISYDIKDFETGEENIVKEEIIKKVQERNRLEYPEAFAT